MKGIVLKHVLKNAADFKGKANPNVVLGTVLKEMPELKADVPALRKEIEEAIKSVEKLSLELIKLRLQETAPELLQEKEEEIKGPLKPLPNAQNGKVVVRIAPSPSGLLHIGHTYGGSLNYEYAKMYEGKFLLRIEDTDPENIYPPAYKLIVDDAQWLTGGGVDNVFIQSSRLGIYYDCAEKLVALGKAYVCTCDADQWREWKKEGKSCSCREIPVAEQQQRYAKMFNEYAEGEAVLRLKTDLQDKNPAMRDFAIMRINEHVHPMTGKEQRVWPLMVFSVAVDDHEMGITHVLNGKEHADNAAKEQIIMKYLGWQPPIYKHWGRINFEGFAVSKSKTRIAIEEGKYTGWDDIRLPFLQALRRRGYQPEAFRRYALEVGLSLNDKTVTIEEFWKNINAFNREIIEPKANRYFFVEKPVAVTIAGIPKKKVLLDLHPDFPKRGKRELSAGGEVYIAESDYQRLSEGLVHRLMDYCNFQIVNGKWKFVSESYEDYKNAERRGMIIHWLPMQRNAPRVEVCLEDGSKTQGVGEESMNLLKKGAIVQLERMYFGRVDAIEGGNITIWYLHR